MGAFQIWLHRTLLGAPAVTEFMRTDWAWPVVESIHFIGLTLLFGTIAVWDLRLLGFMTRVPISALHRLVPFAVLGFAINAGSGSMFLMTEPNQYVYNPAFQFKLLLLRPQASTCSCSMRPCSGASTVSLPARTPLGL